MGYNLLYKHTSRGRYQTTFFFTRFLRSLYVPLSCGFVFFVSEQKGGGVNDG